MLEERSASQPVDYETIIKHVQQLNELIADGSEVRKERKDEEKPYQENTYRWRVIVTEQPFTPGPV